MYFFMHCIFLEKLINPSESSTDSGPHTKIVTRFILLPFFFLGPHPQHMEVPRLEAESELQLLAYATATATWDLSGICDLHHSSHQIPDPLAKARDQTCIFMDNSQIHFCCATMGTHYPSSLNSFPKKDKMKQWFKTLSSRQSWKGH